METALHKLFFHNTAPSLEIESLYEFISKLGIWV